MCNMHRLRVRRYGDPNVCKKVHTHPSEEARVEALKASKQRDYQKNREAYKARTAKWQREHPAKVAEGVNRRQRQLLHATPEWLTAAHWAEMDAIYLEARRLTQATGLPFEVDHIIPLRGKSVCGLHVPWNLRVVSRHENRTKGNTTP